MSLEPFGNCLKQLQSENQSLKETIKGLDRATVLYKDQIYNQSVVIRGLNERITELKKEVGK